MRRCVSCVVLCLLIQLSVAEASVRASNGAVVAPAASAVLRGRVVDTSGGAVSGAKVTAMPLPAGVPTSVATDSKGAFEIAAAPGAYIVRVDAEGFVETARRFALVDGAEATADFTLEIAGIHESVAVEGAGTGYAVPVVSSATRTPTPLRDVPQAVSVVSRALIADQRMSRVWFSTVMRWISTGASSGPKTPRCSSSSST